MRNFSIILACAALVISLAGNIMANRLAVKSAAQDRCITKYETQLVQSNADFDLIVVKCKDAQSIAKDAFKQRDSIYQLLKECRR